MKIRIRDAETNEILHLISIDADDDRRDDIVKQVVAGFDGRDVIVDDSDEDDADEQPTDSVTAVEPDGPTRHERVVTDEAAASLTGDGHPVDAPSGIPAEGTTT